MVTLLKTPLRRREPSQRFCPAPRGNIIIARIGVSCSSARPGLGGGGGEPPRGLCPWRLSAAAPRLLPGRHFAGIQFDLPALASCCLAHRGSADYAKMRQSPVGFSTESRRFNYCMRDRSFARTGLQRKHFAVILTRRRGEEISEILQIFWHCLGRFVALSNRAASLRGIPGMDNEQLTPKTVFLSALAMPVGALTRNGGAKLHECISRRFHG